MLDNKYRPKRGEVYYMAFNDKVGYEVPIGRPVLIVSSQQGCDTNDVYLCVYLSTNPREMGVRVPINSLPRKSYALCHCINSFDMRRFRDKMGTLTLKEMEAVDAGLALALGLEMKDSEAEETEKALRFEIASLKNHINQITANFEKKLAEQQSRDQVENDLREKLYEKALEMLAEYRIGRDLGEKLGVSEMTVARQPETIPETSETVPPCEDAVEVPEPVVEDEPKLVDLNTCEESELRDIGFSASVAKRIVAARPYTYIDDLRGVPGVTRIGYQLVEHKITVSEVKREEPEPEETPVPMTEKVNVNRATPEELQKIGMGIRVTKSIQAYRNKHGKFTCLEDLLAVPGFGKTVMKKYGPMLEV